MKISECKLGLPVRFKDCRNPGFSGIIVSKVRRHRQHYIMDVLFCDNILEDVKINLMEKYKVGENLGHIY